MITIKQHTWQYKTKRVFKYMIVLFVVMVVCQIVDVTMNHFSDSAFFNVKEDWRMLQGAMMYRLIATWNYK